VKLRIITSTVLALALVACGPIGKPMPATPEPSGALYVVTNGPYPLYGTDGEWLASRVGGLSLTQADDLLMTDRRVAQVQKRISPDDRPWLHSGCIFDVLGTVPDQQEATYAWAYGHVVRCDELITSDVPEPAMGVPPRHWRVFDGLEGYFPMRFLGPYVGELPAPRQ
jgi:hypothetical protein